MSELHFNTEDYREAWADLAGRDVLELSAEQLQVAAVEGLMASGRPGVAFRFDLPSGPTVIVRFALNVLLAAADMFKARWGDPRVDQVVPELDALYQQKRTGDLYAKLGVSHNLGGDEHRVVLFKFEGVLVQGHMNLLHVSEAALAEKFTKLSHKEAEHAIRLQHLRRSHGGRA